MACYNCIVNHHAPTEQVFVYVHASMENVSVLNVTQMSFICQYNIYKSNITKICIIIDKALKVCTSCGRCNWNTCN